MLFYHYKNVVNYNILNKFKLKCLNCLPKIKRIALSFAYSSFNFKELVKTILVLELIIPQKISLRSVFNSKIVLKIKNGFINNYKLTLLKKFIFALIEKVFYNVFLNNHNYSSTFLKNKYFCIVKANNLSYFSELKKRNSFVERPIIFKLELLTNVTNSNRLVFLTKSLKLPT